MKLPIQRTKSTASTKNLLINYKSVENPEECKELGAVGKQEIDYVSSDVKELEE